MNSSRAGWGLSAPALGATVLLVALPLLGTLVLAFFRYDALGSPEAVGLEHFRRLAQDPMFARALSNSLLIGAMSLPLRLGLALLLALLLARPGRIARWTWLPLFLPVVLPEIVWAMSWLWIVNPHFGPAAWALDAWQPRGSDWLLTAAGARASIVASVSFLIGELVVVLVAARRQVPAAHYAVCAVEGASALYAFRRVTLPALWPVLLLLAARDAALTLQLAWVPSMIVTKGGPQFATFVLPGYVYQNAFEYLRFGYAAALSLALLAVIGVVVAVQTEALRRWLR